MKLGKRQAGYGYVWALGAVLVIGIYLGQVVPIASTQAQREREAQLLRIGLAYRDAIRSYAELAPNPAERYPAKLSDLLQDPRVPYTRRFLRKLYADPMLSPEWGLILTPDNRIMGIYSQAKGVPLKQDGFGVLYPGFSQAASYQAWRFVYFPDRGPGSRGPRAR